MIMNRLCRILLSLVLVLGCTEIDRPTDPSTQTEKPSTEKPSTQEPTAENPPTENPSTEDPPVEEPPTDNPSTEDPPIENPPVEDPSEEEPLVPEYFREHLKAKEKQINDAIASVEGDYAVFGFFTDSHWGKNQKNTPALINHIIHYTPVQDVVFGGDVITSSFKDPDDAFKLGQDFRHAFDTLQCNMYYLYGNHDNNSDGHPTETNIHLSDERVYSYLQQGMAPCNYRGFFNFYYDREECKTRFICLDTGRFYYSQLRGNIIETAKFLIESLKSTPEGWRIVMLSHIWCHLRATEPQGPFFPDYMRQFNKILDNYNEGTSGVFKYNEDSLEYDFTNVSSKIICCIGGHCHLDLSMPTNDGIPVIMTATDSALTLNGEVAAEGTIDEQVVSVFVIDYAKRIINLIRIGRGNDNEINY